MRNWTQAFALLSVSVVLFAAGALSAVYREWGNSETKLIITNASSKPVDRLVIRLNSCARSSVTILEKQGSAQALLPAGEQTAIYVNPCGEGAIQMEAVAQDGSVLKTKPEYIESGYRVEATYGKNEFEFQINALRLF